MSRMDSGPLFSQAHINFFESRTDRGIAEISLYPLPGSQRISFPEAAAPMVQEPLCNPADIVAVADEKAHLAQDKIIEPVPCRHRYASASHRFCQRIGMALALPVGEEDEIVTLVENAAEVRRAERTGEDDVCLVLCAEQ